MTFSCSEPQIVPITFVSTSRSYLLLPGTAQIDGLSVSFQFRTWNKDGLLLFTELSENSGHLLVYLHGGRLTLLIQKETENPVEITEGVYFFVYFHLSPSETQRFSSMGWKDQAIRKHPIFLFLLNFLLLSSGKAWKIDILRSPDSISLTVSWASMFLSSHTQFSPVRSHEDLPVPIFRLLKSAGSQLSHSIFPQHKLRQPRSWISLSDCSFGLSLYATLRREADHGLPLFTLPLGLP